MNWLLQLLGIKPKVNTTWIDEDYEQPTRSERLKQLVRDQEASIDRLTELQNRQIRQGDRTSGR